MVERMSAEARKAALRDLAGWAETPGREAITKTFVFKSDHHPEWRNVYKTVEVVLATHDANGLTKRDIDLAKAMNAIAGQFGVG
jgi:4a-hydroxytetrahydrobiopterin dehydratase